MATFNIHQDRENASVLPSKAKENVAAQKRTVLRVLNKNPEQMDARLPIYVFHGLLSSDFTSDMPSVQTRLKKKDIGTKKTTAVKGTEENEKQYPSYKVVNQKQRTKSGNQILQQTGKDFKIFEENVIDNNVAGVCKEKFTIKDENKGRVLKDKLLHHEKPSSSKEISIPACITELPREPMVSSVYSSLTIESSIVIDNEEIAQASPMSVDVSKSGSTLKLEQMPRKDEPSLNERLFACEEYKTEIFVYLRSLQNEHRPRKNYMLKQPDISYSMRAILVDWLVEVVEEYRMKTETLYLAVSYIDRFLSYMSVVRAKLQLVGTAAMFIASKFEEIYPPDVKDFVFVTDDTYSKKQVLRMENLILKVLSFDLSTPTILYFLTYFLSNYPTTDRVKYLAMYLCELTLLEADPFLEFLPSDIAASALIVARYTLEQEIREEVFPEKFQESIDHHIEDLITCIAALDKVFQKSANNPQKAIHEKYKSDKYRNVSLITPLSEDCSAVVRKKYLNKEMKESVSQS